MRTDKTRAIKLRLSGQSYKQISDKLQIPKSTLSGWFSLLSLSPTARKKIEQRGYKKAITALVKRNKQQTIFAFKRAHTIQAQAASEINKLSSRELLIVGAVLYWAEGYKRLIIRNGKERTHHVVSLTNSDPALVKIFIRFLKEICLVPPQDIRISIRMFENQNEKNIRAYWLAVTGMPKSNFGKIYKGISISSQRKKPFNRLPYGIVQVIVQKTVLFHRILGHIEGIKKNM